MKAVVLGLGISGSSAADYLIKKGYEVIGVDHAQNSFDGIDMLSDLSDSCLEGVDLVVKSPGIHYQHPWVQAAASRSIPIMGEIDLALSELASSHKKVLAVTGSNGKTTTTLLAAHLLNANGISALAAGNVGVPLLSQIQTNCDVLVVELSSFQLERVSAKPIIDGAVILNITPNHLDRYPSFEEYCQAKLNIALCLKQDAPLWITDQVEELCGEQISWPSIKKVETIWPLEYRDNHYRLFPHDEQNALAAFSLTQVPLEILRKGIESFIRPPHRLEFVREIAGVKYMNDSKATSVDAVIHALQALQPPLILIAGGVDKGGAFSDWLPACKGKVKCVLALGAAAERIKREIGKEVRVQIISTLQEGVHLAASQACRGDTVLLSPGCSSYDQFRDYEDRGRTFIHIVRELL